MGNIVTNRPLWPDGVIPFRFDDSPPGNEATGLSARVGRLPAGTRDNRSVDVLRIQRLLNRVPSAKGGPQPRLAESGSIDHATITAIERFQRSRFGWSDGIVDPGHATWIELTQDEIQPESAGMRGVFLNAVHEWNQKLENHIHWVRHTPGVASQPNYVVFGSVTNGPSRSQTGMMGGAQPLVINPLGAATVIATAPGGSLKGVVLHEMCHAAGLMHEHLRSDRDQYITLNLSGVAANRLRDFAIPSDPPSAPRGCYDFVSLMHYTRTQSGGSLSRKPQYGSNCPLGNLNTFSIGDLNTLKGAYPARS